MHAPSLTESAVGSSEAPERSALNIEVTISIRLIAASGFASQNASRDIAAMVSIAALASMVFC